MSASFEAMSESQRRSFQGAYLRYLKARDGVPDRDARRFDVRERFFAEVDAAPTCWVGAAPVDQRVFDRNHALRRPEEGLDEVTLWALATAKTNRAERYGVEYSITHEAAPADAPNDPHTYIQIEEFYHTRILKDALAALGLTAEVHEPSFFTRVMVRAMVHLPAGVANVAVLSGEIVGVTLFTLLLEKARVLFAAQPAALARIEQLFAQILVDEVGHVHFVRSQLGPWQLAASRRLVPVVLRSLVDDIPELERLFGWERLYAHAMAADVDAAAAACPDRFVVPAA